MTALGSKFYDIGFFLASVVDSYCCSLAVLFFSRMESAKFFFSRTIPCPLQTMYLGEADPTLGSRGEHLPGQGMTNESILSPQPRSIVQGRKMSQTDPMRACTELFLVLMRWSLSLGMLGALTFSGKSVPENETSREGQREGTKC